MPSTSDPGPITLGVADTSAALAAFLDAVPLAFAVLRAAVGSHH